MVGAYWLLISRALGIAGSAAIAILAVRLLSVAAWGRYSAVMALIAVAAVFANSGLGTLGLREMTEDPAGQDRILGVNLAASLVTAVAVSLLAVPAALLIGVGVSRLWLVALALPLCFLQPATGLLQVAFSARDQLQLAARFQVVQTVAFVAVGVAVLVWGLGPGGLILANVLAAAAALVAALGLMERRLSLRPRMVDDPGAVWRSLRAAAPLASIGIVTIVYDRLDVMMLSAIRGPHAVAHYTVPYNLVTLTAVVPSVLALGSVSTLTRDLRETPAVAPSQFLFLVRLFFLISVPAAIVLGFAGSDLLSLVFGDRYRHATDVLAVLAPAPIVTFQAYAFWYPVLLTHQEHRVFRIRVAGLGLNLVLNAVLISLYGPIGAAISWLVTELFTALVQALVVHRHVFRLPAGSLLGRPIVAGAVALAVALAGSAASPVVGALAGAAVYIAALFLTHYVDIRELTSVLQTLPTHRGPAGS